MLNWRRKLFRSAFSEDFSTPLCDSITPLQQQQQRTHPTTRGLREAPPHGHAAAAAKRRHRLSSGEPSKLIRSVGRKGHKAGQFSTPTGIAVTRYGDVIVVDSDNSRVQVFGSDLRLRVVLGSRGSLPHQFNQPMCVSLTRDPAENLVITDSANASVKIWQQDGTFVTEFAQDGIFDFPCGVATTSEHNIVVTDLSQHCVTVLHDDGTLRNKFGCYGDKARQFDHPYFVATSESDTVFVSDSGNMCIKSFDLDGKLLQYFNMADFRLMDEVFVLLQGITVDSENHVLVIGNSSIYICAQNGRMWEVVIPSEDGDLHSPKCLAHSASLGQLLVTQVGLDQNHEVSAFEYHSEDYHSLKCVPNLTYEGRAKDHLMRKAKSLDSSAPATTKYFPSHVNGYVVPPRKSASQKGKGTRGASHRKSADVSKETAAKSSSTSNGDAKPQKNARSSKEKLQKKPSLGHDVKKPEVIEKVSDHGIMEMTGMPSEAPTCQLSA